MNTPSQSTDSFEPFELDDKYVITGLIAQGAMGKVYAGETKLVHRPIAIKILRSELVNNPEMLLRFKLEAEIASSLNHPNIVNVFGSGMTPAGEPYLAMDYVDGKSLESLLQDSTKLDTNVCVDVFVQLARALEYTHEKGVIHRDLKPSNVMMQAKADGSYLVRLLDFGIAKSTSVEDTVARALTLPGTVFGSVYYMSPEQILGKNVNFQSDIYSFGCLFFHALTGQPPYKASSPVDCMQMHVSEVIPNLAEHLATSPSVSALSEIVNTCMQKDPSRRFAGSQALRISLEKVEEAMNIAAAASSSSSEKIPSDSMNVNENRRNDILSFLTVLALAGLLYAIPFAVNLNLADAAKGEAETKPRKHDGGEDLSAKAVIQTETRVNESMAQAHLGIQSKDLDAAETAARTAYLTSLSLPHDDPLISDSLFLLGKIFEAKQNYQGASQAYNWALSFNQARYGAMAPQTVEVMERLKALKLLMNDPASATKPPLFEVN